MKLVSESIKDFFVIKRLNEFQKKTSPYDALTIGIESVIKDWARKNTKYNVDVKRSFYPWLPPPRTYSLLWIAARFNHPLWVKALLDKGYNPNENNSAALRWASGLGHKNVVAILLDAGADPDASGPNLEKEAYVWARRNGHMDIVKMLDMSKSGYTFTDKEPFSTIFKDFREGDIETSEGERIK
ncbi:MAG TPA: ankyrin repeat domain-containing protein [Candidatus Diapherotrites archaeon]|nr:ankyrin repeat domain-containing protein [Candidatus Diapherotrites archaeon]